jgi:hypothetical protein
MSEPQLPEALSGAARGQDRRACRRLVPAELGERGRVDSGEPQPVDLGTDRVRVRAAGAETVDGTRINEASATAAGSPPAAQQGRGERSHQAACNLAPSLATSACSRAGLKGRPKLVKLADSSTRPFPSRMASW